MNNLLRILSLSLCSWLVWVWPVDANAQDNGPYLNCHDDKDCGSEYECVGHKHGTCAPSANPKFELNCCSQKELSLQCGSSATDCDGDVSGECRKRKKSLSSSSPEAIAEEVLQLQKQGLVEIVCHNQTDCPVGTVCVGGHCKND